MKIERMLVNFSQRVMSRKYKWLHSVLFDRTSRLATDSRTRDLRRNPDPILSPCCNTPCIVPLRSPRKTTCHRASYVAVLLYARRKLLSFRSLMNGYGLALPSERKCAKIARRIESRGNRDFVSILRVVDRDLET